MKKILLLLAVMIACCQQSNAQAITTLKPDYYVPHIFNGHTYFSIPPSSFSDAKETAEELGGHLVFIDSEDEYRFVDSTFVWRTTGWWWSGTTAKVYTDNLGYNFLGWMNDDDEISYLNYKGYLHWLYTNTSRPSVVDNLLVLGKFQITARSTKWVMKYSQFTPSFASRYQYNAVVELE